MTHSFHFDLSIDTLTIIIVFNVLGTGLQWGLKKLHDKYKYRWTDGPLMALNFTLGMVAVLIANRRHPITEPEVKE